MAGISSWFLLNLVKTVCRPGRMGFERNQSTEHAFFDVINKLTGDKKSSQTRFFQIVSGFRV